MYKLAPSLLAADFTALGLSLMGIEKAGAHMLHIDVMDGHFVPNISFGLPVISSIRRCTKLEFDVHLMVTEPEKHIEAYAKAGADCITIHWECFEHDGEILRNCIEIIRTLNKKVGVALNPHTQLEPLLPYVELVDMVLIMSVEPGFGGQALLPFTLNKAERLAAYIKQNDLNVAIQMDGGIDRSNLKTVLNSGVTVVVAGSSVFGAADVGHGVRAFLETFRSYEIRQRNMKKAQGRM